MPGSSLKHFLRQIIIACLLIVISSIVYNARHVTTDTEQHASRFQEAFHLQEQKIKELFSDFIEEYRHTEGEVLKDKEYLEHLSSLYKEKNLIFTVYEGNNLLFWSHNAIPQSDYQAPDDSIGVKQLQNGWYYYQTERVQEKTLVIYYALKKDFAYQNQYLVNQFDDAMPDLEDVFFLSDRKDQGIPVTGADGSYLFSLVLRREGALVQPLTAVYVLSLMLAIGGLAMIIYYAFRYFSRLFSIKKRGLAIGGFMITMALVRLVSFWWQIPRVFYQGRMFSPELYHASPFLPSLGDLLMNVAFITIIGYFLFHHLRKFNLASIRNRNTAVFSSMGLFAAIYLICSLALYLIEGLVINSNLSLDVNFIFNLDIYSLAGFIIIGFIFFAFFFFSIVLCRLALNILKSVKDTRLSCAATFAVLFLLTWIIWGASPLVWMLAIAAFLVFELDHQQPGPRQTFATLVISLFLFSLIASIALHYFNKEKDLETRKTLVKQLATEQDPVAEFLFEELEDALFSDNQLQNLVRKDPYNETVIHNYLRHHYFYDFWAKYELQVTVCQPGEILLIKPDNVERECAAFFSDYIQRVGVETVSDKLVYLDNDTGRNSYITRIAIGQEEGTEQMPVYHVYLEFDAKYIVRDMGFPELLIDETIDINRELVNYSYATYKEGLLVNESGPFMYNVDVAVYESPENEFKVIDFDGYNHLIYQKDEETLYIISRPQKTFLETMAPFSYLFITFFILVVIFWLLTSRKKPAQLFTITLRRRLQYSMVAILVVSALTIGGVSAWVIYNMYEDKNLSMLNEKTHSILVELENELGDAYSLDPSMEYYFYDLLLEYANVFFTDINLYDPDGFLLASSRPKVFEEGLVGSKMNRLAYHHLHEEQKSRFVHTEHIGNLEYMSAYTPVYNRYNEVLGYLNLPYFAKQEELRSEMSYFLVAFINIYLFLLVLVVVVALFISNYMTRPLQLIREQLSRVRLGKTNQKIHWTREDEIGELIREYNRMIDELTVSAELLARSERETAWREMARQVAHEIKNPLTPMRLNVQYLEKAWKEQAPDWDERLGRFTKTMIEQIDNLSVIAGEFSDFAKMPAGKKEQIDLRALIPEVLELYQDFENVNIYLETPPDDQPMPVFADNNQLRRVFTNLISNAVQSYGKGETATIRIRCIRETDYFKTEITDWGSGVTEQDKAHIFNPYFTTKAKGMGLGLAMVKNIIESFNGSVSFISEEGQGSTFFVYLPRGEQ